MDTKNTVKGIARDYDVRMESVWSTLVNWALTHPTFNVDDVKHLFISNKPRGAKANVDKLRLELEQIRDKLKAAGVELE